MQCSISPSVVKLPDEVLCFRPEEMYMMNWLVWHLLTPAVRKLVTKHNPHKEVWLPSNKFPKFCFSLALHGKKVTKKPTKTYQPPVASNAVKEQTGSRHGADMAFIDNSSQQSPQTGQLQQPCPLATSCCLAPHPSFWALLSFEAAALRSQKLTCLQDTGLWHS